MKDRREVRWATGYGNRGKMK